MGQAEAGKALDLKRTISRGIVSKLQRALGALNDAELARNRLSPIATCIDEYNECVAKEYCVEFWAIIGGVPDKGLMKACQRFGKVALKPYPKHSLRIIDASTLLTQYCIEVGRWPYPDISLRTPSGQCFKHGEDALLATITGKSPVEAVRQTGIHIFEANARLPLLRSDVNTEIDATVKRTDGRKNFWNFNNGLTILCDDFKVRSGRVDLTHAQIVNGCQTTYTLFKNASSVDSVELMCRIIRKAPPALAERIRRATNLHNPVTERDLRSGDLVQRTLQIEFKQRGYFYERKRYEYANFVEELGKPNVVAQFPKGSLDNLRLAQLALTFWHERPAPAKMQAKRIFVRSSTALREELERDLPEGFYDTVFHPAVSAVELLFPHLVAKYLLDEFSIGYQPWGARHTRRYMIQTHGSLTVLALVALAVRKKYRLELPVAGKEKQFLRNVLVPLFENRQDGHVFFAVLRKAVNSFMSEIDGWTARAAKRQRREEGEVDIRGIFSKSDTFKTILTDRRMREAVRMLQKRLPEI